MCPYLLRGLAIVALTGCGARPSPASPSHRTPFHLAAVMDWASRHVLSWRLSNTMDSALKRRGAGRRAALRGPGDVQHGPGGAPTACSRTLTSTAFTGKVRAAGALCSMERPRPLSRQHLHRAPWRSQRPVAFAEVRGGVPVRDRGRPRRGAGGRLVDRLLQRTAVARPARSTGAHWGRPRERAGDHARRERRAAASLALEVADAVSGSCWLRN